MLTTIWILTACSALGLVLGIWGVIAAKGPGAKIASILPGFVLTAIALGLGLDHVQKDSPLCMTSHGAALYIGKKNKPTCAEVEVALDETIAHFEARYGTKARAAFKGIEISFVDSYPIDVGTGPMHSYHTNEVLVVGNSNKSALHKFELLKHEAGHVELNHLGLHPGNQAEQHKIFKQIGWRY